MNRRLVNARKAKGLTQETMARIVGIKRSSYAHIECGRTPLLSTALRIAQVLGEPVESLFMDLAVPKQHMDADIREACR